MIQSQPLIELSMWLYCLFWAHEGALDCSPSVHTQLYIVNLVGWPVCCPLLFKSNVAVSSLGMLFTLSVPLYLNQPHLDKTFLSVVVISSSLWSMLAFTTDQKSKQLIETERQLVVMKAETQLAAQRAVFLSAAEAAQGRLAAERAENDFMELLSHRLRSPLAALDLAMRAFVIDANQQNDIGSVELEMRQCIQQVNTYCDMLANKQSRDKEKRLFANRHSVDIDDTPATTTLPVFNASVPTQLKVLLVDDDDMIRTSQHRFLVHLAENDGHKMSSVGVKTGEECLSLMSSEQGNDINVVICDQFMHDAGGVLLGSQTVLRLRQRGFGGLIIGCSGNSTCKPLFIDAGADHFW